MKRKSEAAAGLSWEERSKRKKEKRRRSGDDDDDSSFLKKKKKHTETDDAFEILADVPGVEHSRVNLLVDGDVVSIEVSEQREKQEENTLYYRSERSSSFQSRSVRLPPSARMDELKADVEHGVLHVRVPKEKKKEHEGKGPRRIKIGGGGGGGVISAEEVKKAPSPAEKKEAPAVAASVEKKK